ncbi:MAG: MMPL family transporter [Actinomycetota bacterium]
MADESVSRSKTTVSRRKTTGSKTSTRKTIARKTTARKPATKSARKATARRPTRKAPARKTRRKAPARRPAARKAPARKHAARKAPARKHAARKAPARKVVARRGRRPPTSAFYRLGHFAVRNRLRILAVWVVAVVAVSPVLGKLADRLSQGGFEVPGSESDVVTNTVQDRFQGQFEFTSFLVLHSEQLTANQGKFEGTFQRAQAELLQAPGVALVTNPYEQPEGTISLDGHTVTAVIGLTDDQDQALQHNDEVEGAVERATAGTGIEGYITGSPSFYAAFTETTTHDLERAESIGLPISLIILLLAFGTLVAAGVPLFMALLGLALTFGILSVIAATTTVSIFSQNLAAMIGIGVGIDFSLFIVNRFREELRTDRGVPEAVARSMATSGRAVMVSGLATVTALAGTQLVNIQAFRSMGWGAMIAVTIAVLAALTLLPALLGMLGWRINKLRIGSRLRAAGRGGTWWHRWATEVMRRPWFALVGSLAVLAVLAFPAKDLTLGSSGPSILPTDARPRIGAEIVGQAFGEGLVAPVEIVVETEQPVLSTGFKDVYDVAQLVKPDPEVVRVDSIATIPPSTTLEEALAEASLPEAQPFILSLVSTDARSTLVRAVTRHGPQSDETAEFVSRLREKLATSAPPGVTVLVGGDAGLNVDINEELERKLFPVVGLVLALSFIVLLIFFRSLLLPLKAMFMNAAGVIATYGVLVFIFQSGHFEGFFGFEAAGHLEAFLPLFLFTILFGLSMDYEVFMLSRIREEYLRTKDNTEAVGWGLERTGKIITSAAAIMVSVFGAFAFARLVPIKAMGFGLATAVFLDATLIRVVLVPAAMRLMGRWNWWLPRWLDQRMPNVSLEGVEPTVVRARRPAPARAAA